MTQKPLWITVFAAVIVLAIVNARLAMELSSTQNERDSLIRLRQEKHLLIAALDPQRKKAVLRHKAIALESEPIFSRLEQARELEDVGLAGDEIVSTTVFNRKNGYRIYFYVPSGDHKLAFYQHDTSPNGFDRTKADLETIDLKPNATYEIRFTPIVRSRASNESSLTLSDSNGKVATESFTFADDTSTLRVNSKVRCYPSQLSDMKTHGHKIGFDGSIGELMNTGQPRLPVEIAVASFTLKDKSKSLVRFFIQSDAPANIPADTVATWWHLLAENGSTSITETISKTFRPYDGSGRYIFKSDFIERRRSMFEAKQ